jgi:hypothetical protein
LAGIEPAQRSEPRDHRAAANSAAVLWGRKGHLRMTAICAFGTFERRLDSTDCVEKLDFPSITI